jgi:hypothetical protein
MLREWISLSLSIVVENTPTGMQLIHSVASGPTALVPLVVARKKLVRLGKQTCITNIADSIRNCEMWKQVEHLKEPSTIDIEACLSANPDDLKLFLQFLNNDINTAVGTCLLRLHKSDLWNQLATAYVEYTRRKIEFLSVRPMLQIRELCQSIVQVCEGNLTTEPNAKAPLTDFHLAIWCTDKSLPIYCELRKNPLVCNDTISISSVLDEGFSRQKQADCSIIIIEAKDSPGQAEMVKFLSNSESHMVCPIMIGEKSVEFAGVLGAKRGIVIQNIHATTEQSQLDTLLKDLMVRVEANRWKAKLQSLQFDQQDSIALKDSFSKLSACIKSVEEIPTKGIEVDAWASGLATIASDILVQLEATQQHLFQSIETLQVEKTSLFQAFQRDLEAGNSESLLSVCARYEEVTRIWIKQKALLELFGHARDNWTKLLIIVGPSK